MCRLISNFVLMMLLDGRVKTPGLGIHMCPSICEVLIFTLLFLHPWIIQQVQKGVIRVRGFGEFGVRGFVRRVKWPRPTGKPRDESQRKRFSESRGPERVSVIIPRGVIQSRRWYLRVSFWVPVKVCFSIFEMRPSIAEKTVKLILVMIDGSNHHTCNI